MAKWLRVSLLIGLSIVGAGLWGFVVTVMGAPSMVVSFGALVIGALVFVWAFGKNSN